MNLRSLYNRAESASFLDGVSATLQHRLRTGLGRTPLGDRLRGDWLGHPVHPVLVTIPIGAWTSSLVFDTLLRDHRTARRLIGLGLISSLPALATGWADWSERDTRQRRVGLLHAGINAIGIDLMLASYLRRRRHPDALDPRALALSTAALAAVGAAGALGGHLTYGQGAGLETTTVTDGPAFDPVLADLDAAVPAEEPAGTDAHSHVSTAKEH